MDSLGVLFISGQSNLNNNAKLRVRGVQSVDIIKVVEPITKAQGRLDNVQSFYLDLQHLISECLSNRPGPVWVDVSLAMQAKEI